MSVLNNVLLSSLLVGPVDTFAVGSCDPMLTIDQQYAEQTAGVFDGEIASRLINEAYRPVIKLLYQRVMMSPDASLRREFTFEFPVRTEIFDPAKGVALPGLAFDKSFVGQLISESGLRVSFTENNKQSMLRLLRAIDWLDRSVKLLIRAEILPETFSNGIKLLSQHTTAGPSVATGLGLGAQWTLRALSHLTADPLPDLAAPDLLVRMINDVEKPPGYVERVAFQFPKVALGPVGESKYFGNPAEFREDELYFSAAYRLFLEHAHRANVSTKAGLKILGHGCPMAQSPGGSGMSTLQMYFKTVLRVYELSDEVTPGSSPTPRRPADSSVPPANAGMRTPNARTRS